MLVVKADAYGHGAIGIARHALRCGVSSLGVGTSTEALALRRVGLRVPILVLGTVIEDEVPAPEPGTPAEAPRSSEYYLLQAGSFRQQEDADRRRAELLLLGLEPTIRESTGDNGRWFRVYLGPFETRSKMSRARSLAAAQNIDTLVLKRSG